MPIAAGYDATGESQMATSTPVVIVHGPINVNSIRVAGFKSLHDPQKLTFRPLTILAGANSAGKSSIMQPLLLLKQTLEAPFDPGGILLDGPNVAVSSGDQLLTRAGSRKKSDHFSLELLHDDTLVLRLAFAPNKRVGLIATELEYVDDEDSYSLKLDMSPADVKRQIDKVHSSNRRVWIPQSTNAGESYTVGVERGLLYPGTRDSASTNSYLSRGYHLPDPAEALKPLTAGLIHVPGLRGNRQASYTKSAGRAPFTGSFESYIASILLEWQLADDPRLPLVGEWLGLLGLTWKAEAEQLSDSQVRINVGRTVVARRGGAKDLVNISQVGFGVSQALPVVVALLAAENRGLVYIEQPELHLHPKAQLAMATLLAKAAANGARVVIETHSSLLLLQLQTLVADGELGRDLVGLNWFSRNEEGFSEVTSANLDEKGSFGSWPEDFDDVSLGAERAYIAASEKAMRP